MESLPYTIVKKKMIYKQIIKSDKAAMYSQTDEGGKLLGYEVFVLKYSKGYKWPNGTISLPGEMYPNDEAFGSWAWSFGIYNNPEEALDKANKRFKELSDGTFFVDADLVDDNLSKTLTLDKPVQGIKGKIILDLISSGVKDLKELVSQSGFSQSYCKKLLDKNKV